MKKSNSVTVLSKWKISFLSDVLIPVLIRIQQSVASQVTTRWYILIKYTTCFHRHRAHDSGYVLRPIRLQISCRHPITSQNWICSLSDLIFPSQKRILSFKVCIKSIFLVFMTRISYSMATKLSSFVLFIHWNIKLIHYSFSFQQSFHYRKLQVDKLIRLFCKIWANRIDSWHLSAFQNRLLSSD